MPNTKTKRAAKKQVKAKPKQIKKTAARKKQVKPNDAKRNLYESFVNRISKKEILKPSEIKLFRQLESELDSTGNGGGSRGNILSSMEEAAAYVGASKKTISVNIKRGRLRQNPDGTFDKAELDKFLSRFGRKGSADEVESTRVQQEKAELRYRLARARREEILTAQLEKTLAPWEEILTEWAARVREVAAGLDAWSDRLPALLVGRSREQIHELIKCEVKELRQRFSREGRYCPECDKEAQ